MSLFSRIAKKLRRRTRVQSQQRSTKGLTTAEKLYASFASPSFYNTQSRYGIISAAERRASKRLIEHRNIWKNTPDGSRLSRQQYRWVNRDATKYRKSTNVSGLPIPTDHRGGYRFNG